MFFYVRLGRRKKKLSQRKRFMDIMCLNPGRDSVQLNTEREATGVKQ